MGTKDNKIHFDMSDDTYKPDNENKKVVGKIKDKLKRCCNEEFYYIESESILF